MASLTIRDLDDDVKSKLKIQAAEHGRSMESEVRFILAAAVSPPRPATGLATFIRRGFDEIGGVDLELPARHDVARHADFQ